MGFAVSKRGRIYWRDSRGRFSRKGTGTKYSGSTRISRNRSSVSRQRSRGAGVVRSKSGKARKPTKAPKLRIGQSYTVGGRRMMYEGISGLGRYGGARGYWFTGAKGSRKRLTLKQVSRIAVSPKKVRKRR